MVYPHGKCPKDGQWHREVRSHAAPGQLAWRMRSPDGTVYTQFGSVKPTSTLEEVEAKYAEAEKQRIEEERPLWRKLLKWLALR